MSEFKHHYYVALFAADNRLYFVTELNGTTATWKRGKLPVEFTHKKATLVADGLCKNGYQAVVIQSAGAVAERSEPT